FARRRVRNRRPRRGDAARQEGGRREDAVHPPDATRRSATLRRAGSARARRTGVAMTYTDAANWVRGRLWIAVAAGCVPWLLWIGGLVHVGGKKDLGGNLVGADHLAFYYAARLIRDGESWRIYNYGELRDESYQ